MIHGRRATALVYGTTNTMLDVRACKRNGLQYLLITTMCIERIPFCRFLASLSMGLYWIFRSFARDTELRFCQCLFFSFPGVFKHHHVVSLNGLQAVEAGEMLKGWNMRGGNNPVCPRWPCQVQTAQCNRLLTACKWSFLLLSAKAEMLSFQRNTWYTPEDARMVVYDMLAGGNAVQWREGNFELRTWSLPQATTWPVGSTGRVTSEPRGRWI